MNTGDEVNYDWAKRKCAFIKNYVCYLCNLTFKEQLSEVLELHMEMRLNLNYDYSILVTQSLFLLYGEIFYLLLPYCFRNIKHDCSSIVFSLMKVHRIVALTFDHISRRSIERLIKKRKCLIECLISKRDASL